MTSSRMVNGLPIGLAAAALVATAGCGAQPRETTVAEADPAITQATDRTDPPRPAARDQAAKPDLSRLSFNPSNRTLTLYELPDKSARWMLASPTAPGGVPVGLNYQFPMDADLDLSKVTVFYTLSNRRPSTAVSLREIVDTRSPRTL